MAKVVMVKEDASALTVGGQEIEVSEEGKALVDQSLQSELESHGFVLDKEATAEYAKVEREAQTAALKKKDSNKTDDNGGGGKGGGGDNGGKK